MEGGVTQKEVEEFYNAMKKKTDDNTPVSYGLNSKVVKKRWSRYRTIMEK